MSNRLQTTYTIWDKVAVVVGDAAGMLAVRIGATVDDYDGIMIMAHRAEDCDAIAAGFTEAATKLRAAKAKTEAA